MKVSTRVEYGMLALTDIALHSGNGSSVPAPEIAERQGISQKYLEQIFTHLRQAGLIRAQKGLRGGYTLTRAADTITLAEVINALDNTILEETGTAGNDGARSLRDAVNTLLWGRINRFMTDYTGSITLAEFAQECSNQISGEWDMYII